MGYMDKERLAYYARSVRFARQCDLIAGGQHETCLNEIERLVREHAELLQRLKETEDDLLEQRKRVAELVRDLADARQEVLDTEAMLTEEVNEEGGE